MRKEVIIGIDSANQIYAGYERGVFYGEDRLRQLVRCCAEAGINTVYWRVSATGQVVYRSKVRTVIGEHPERIEGFSLASVEQLVLRQCDPPAVVVEEAHKCGLKIFGYITLFDEYYPGLESAFQIAHPEYTWKHRLRNHHLRGLLSYAYPEVRAHRLKQVEELNGYGFDGLYLDTARSHGGIQPIIAMPLTGGDPYQEYGFNEPEVEEFKRRTGVDPTVRNPADAPLVDFDRDAWNRLRGEYLTQFIREVREKTNQADLRLAVGFYTDADCYLSPAGRRGRVPMGRFHHDYETWVEEDLVDAFVLIAEHRRYGAKDWREHSAPQFARAREKGKRVYLWAATEERIDELDNAPGALPVAIADEPERFYEALGIGINACLDTSADGVYLYEAYAPEMHAGYWKTVGEHFMPKVNPRKAAAGGAAVLSDELWDFLRKTDTPTLSNAIERLKIRPLTNGFCDGSVRCLFPDLGVMCGYAVTAHVATLTDEPGDFKTSMVPLVEALAATPKPAVIVFQEATGHRSSSAHCGEVMATIFKRLGAVGVVSDSCVRDVNEVHEMGMHYFAQGCVASHANFRISRVGDPVLVGGLQVRPGDVLHGDANGLITVPAQSVQRLPSLVEQVRRAEAGLMDYVRGDKFKAEGLVDRLTH